MAIHQDEGRVADCCERGRLYLTNYSPSRWDWALWPEDGGTEYHEIRFCPFCGVDLPYTPISGTGNQEKK